MRRSLLKRRAGNKARACAAEARHTVHPPRDAPTVETQHELFRGRCVWGGAMSGCEHPSKTNACDAPRHTHLLCKTVAVARHQAVVVTTPVSAHALNDARDLCARCLHCAHVHSSAKRQRPRRCAARGCGAIRRSSRRVREYATATAKCVLDAVHLVVVSVCGCCARGTCQRRVEGQATLTTTQTRDKARHTGRSRTERSRRAV